MGSQTSKKISYNETIKHHFEFSLPYKCHKRLIFEYSNEIKSFLVNDKNENIISDFKELENIEIIYSDLNSLYYITKENKCYYCDINDLKFNLFNNENIIDIFTSNKKVTFLTNLFVKNDKIEVNLPEIDKDDKFIKFSLFGANNIAYLLTGKGKLYCYHFIVKTNVKYEKVKEVDRIPNKVIDVKCGYSFVIIRCENGDCYVDGDIYVCGEQDSKYVSDKMTSENEEEEEENNLQEGNVINFEFNKPIIKQRIIFEYSNLKNSMLINDKNENLISDFTDIEKSEIIYSSEESGLFYITIDNKCYYLQRDDFTLLDKNKIILNICVNYKTINLLTSDCVYLSNYRFKINLPKIDSDDCFVKFGVFGNENKVYLLTGKGKLFYNEITKENKFEKETKVERFSSKIIDMKCGFSFVIIRCENGNCYVDGDVYGSGCQIK
ncbi:hypothetical protein ABK040_000528 [Willaertia magna]